MRPSSTRRSPCGHRLATLAEVNKDGALLKPFLQPVSRNSLQYHPDARIVNVGQGPGSKVQASGVPFRKCRGVLLHHPPHGGDRRASGRPCDTAPVCAQVGAFGAQAPSTNFERHACRFPHRKIAGALPGTGGLPILPGAVLSPPEPVAGPVTGLARGTTGTCGGRGRGPLLITSSGQRTGSPSARPAVVQCWLARSGSARVGAVLRSGSGWTVCADTAQ